MYRLYPLLFFVIGIISTAQENYGVKNIPPALLKNANSVVLEERVTIEISSPKALTLSSYSVITVLNKNGNEHLSPYVYYDKNVKVKRAEIIIYNSLGKEIKKFKKRDFIDVSAVDGGTLYSDNRMMMIDFTPSDYPYTMKFEYETESSNTAYIQPYYPTKSYRSGVQKSTYLINFASGVKFRYKSFDSSGVIKVTSQPGSLFMQISNLSAFENELHSPRFDEFSPHVLFALDQFYLQGVQGNGSDWGEFGAWMNRSLLNDISSLPEGTKNEIRVLVANETTIEAKARKVYEYVQDKTRYISVQIGIGGWKPMPAIEVDNLGYGDCKALTNYTKSLLEVAGVPSYYTVVYAGANKRNILPDFASLQGNHVILAIPKDEDYIWVECTSQNIPFGFIGDFTDDRDVLVVTPEGGKIAHTKVYSHNQNTLTTTGLCKVDSEGNIVVDVIMESSGIQYDNRYLIETKKEEKKETYYKEYWDYVNNISLSSIVLENNKEDIILREKISFNANAYTSFAGDNLIFNINILNRANYIPRRYKNRKHPLLVARGFIDIDEVYVQLPSDFTLSSIPEPIIIKSKFGNYTSSVTQETNGKLKYNRTFELFEGLYAKEEYEEYRKFRRKVSKSDNQKLVLTKK